MKIKTKRRPSRSSRRNKSVDIAKWTKLVAVPVVALGGGVAVLAFGLPDEYPDGYCYARDDQHQAAIFIDASMTAESSATQVRDYRNAFAHAYDNAPANALISVFTTATDGRSSMPNPVFFMCKPASTPQEQERLGAPSKPAPYLKRQAQEAKSQYLDGVEQVLSSALDLAKSAGDSPLLEQTQAISRYEGFQSNNRSLTWISDGVQNSEMARFCFVQGDMPSYSSFTKSRAFKDTKPRDFSGTDVNVLLVEFGPLPNENAKYCSNAELRDWWPEHFRYNGADNVELTRLRFWAGE